MNKEGGQIKILFFDIKNPLNISQSIFDGVIDCWVGKLFLSKNNLEEGSEEEDETLYHIIVAEQKLKK